MKSWAKIVLIVAVFAAVGLIFFTWATGVYDNTVELQEAVDQKWGDVQSAYQRRADLVPNLVATVKGAAENEKEILTRVTQARAGIVNASTPEEMELLGREINTAINLAFEAYPQIRSTENFLTLQAELEGTENRIKVARDRYNESVRDYNSYIRGYFKSMAIGWLAKEGDDFVRKEPFAATLGAEDVPQVQF
ncbi:MAG: LemA family protein [Flammeovirgaceae bacterium]|nr:LemA family protein [Flammeovirgaceae bacterium]